MYDRIVGMAALATQAVMPPQTAPEHPILWQTLREGMSGEEVATALRSIDGIKSVTVKASRHGPNINISYTAAGIEIAGLTQSVVPTFKDGMLESVSLTSAACSKLAAEKYKALREELAQNGRSVMQREVTEDKQLVAIRDTFSSSAARVRIRWEPQAVPQHVYASGAAGQALSKIHNDAVDAEIAACPNDVGQKATIEITYSDNAKGTAADASAKSEQERAKEADKSKL